MTTMRTIVYQSYRVTDIPNWISRCMTSVREWAVSSGFEYRFIDDSIFKYVPRWYRDKVQDHVFLVTDLARLELAKEFLAHGYHRTIWVDADVIVFDPGNFIINVTDGFAFCREIWLRRQEKFGFTVPLLRKDEKINNAVTVFTSTDSMLDFFIDTIKSHIRETPSSEIGPGDAGTKLFTQLRRQEQLSLLTNVGLFSPLILRDISNGGERYLRKYMKAFGNEIRAANLVHSGFHSTWMGVDLNDSLYERVIDRLLVTKGEVVNRFSKKRKAKEANDR